MTVSARAVLEAAEEVMRGPIVWGRSDCCTSAADTFLRLWGIDPMPTLRGRFDTPLSAAQLVQNDLPVAFQGEMAAAGLQRLAEQPGLIGLCRNDALFGCVAAICIRPGEWVARAEGGFGIICERAMEAYGWPD
ncbi:DUF6950 family protein [Pseudoroseicyclus sp. H15]